MILIMGCNGHIGKEIAGILAKRGEKFRGFDIADKGDMGGLMEFVQGSILDKQAVNNAVKGADTVIDVIGLSRARKNLTHEMVEYGGLKNILSAGKESGVKRILYTSALGAGENQPSSILRAKWKAEQLLANSGLNYTVFRPSGYFVDFSEIFARMIKETGKFQLPGKGNNRIQPIAPEDVADLYLMSVDNEKTFGQVLPIGGPDVFSLNDVVRLVGKVVGKDVEIRHKYLFPMKALAMAMNMLGKPGLRDFLQRVTHDSILTKEQNDFLHKNFPQKKYVRLEEWLRKG
ncbi:MAG: NAD(P)H-binding protein [Planctomycetes bacterium]|nr:NAD(P)H-binding protein [Planctomycetota bacterium]